MRTIKRSNTATSANNNTDNNTSNNEGEMLQSNNEVASRTIEELLRIPVLTSSQVAQLLGEPEARVLRLLRNGRIEGKRISKRWWIPSAQFQPEIVVTSNTPNTNDIGY